MGAKDKVLKQLQQVLLVRDQTGGAATTLGAAAAAGQKVLTVPSTTSVANGDTVRVGSGETMELGVVASFVANTSITLADNLTYDHAVGEAVVEQTAYDVGAIAEGGVTVNGAAQTTDVGVATQRLAYTTLNGYTDLTAQFALPTITPENLAIALGIAFSKITGAGTAASPYQLATDGSEFCGEQNQSLIAIGIAMDGSVLRVELWGVDADYTGLSLQLSRGQLASVPVKLVASAGGVVTTNASAYVANTAKTPAKGKVFDALSEVGLFTDGTAGTLNANAAAAATTMSTATNLGVAAGDWVRVGAGNTVEFHRVDSVTGAGPYNIALRTPLYRAHANGEAIAKQVLVPFAAPSQDGVTLEVSGSVEMIRTAVRRLTAGLKPGAATTTLRFGVIDFLLANFARALGIPQAKIVGGRLPLTGDTIATDTVQGAYVRGLTQDGWTCWVNVWGCAQDISNFAAQLTNTGTPALPIALKPASALHFIQHA